MSRFCLNSFQFKFLITGHKGSLSSHDAGSTIFTRLVFPTYIQETTEEGQSVTNVLAIS